MSKVIKYKIVLSYVEGGPETFTCDDYDVKSGWLIIRNWDEATSYNNETIIPYHTVSRVNVRCIEDSKDEKSNK